MIFTFWQGIGLMLFGILIGMAIGYKLYRNALCKQIYYFMKEQRGLKFKEIYEHFFLLTWIDKLRMKLNGYDFNKNN